MEVVSVPIAKRKNDLQIPKNNLEQVVGCSKPRNSLSNQLSEVYMPNMAKQTCLCRAYGGT